MVNYVKIMKDFIETYPKINEFIHIDYISDENGEYGLMPNGQTIVSREYDVLGNKIINKQYNFILYATNMTVDDLVRLDNINFLDDFTDWIESQETAKPIFGDLPDEEEWSVQNGMLFELNPDKTTGTYQIQINVNYSIRKEAI